MKKIFAAVCLSLLVSACTTTTNIKIPAGSELYLNENPEHVVVNENGDVKTRPYFWSAIAGIPFRLEQNEKIISQGKLEAAFRAQSIFWPPYAIIYWPVGFAQYEYDLTKNIQNPEHPEEVQQVK